MRRIAMGWLFLVALGGCSASGISQVPLSLKDIPVPDNTSIVERGDIRVSPLDVLDIKVFGSADMTGTYQVDPSGHIKMPLLGDVTVKGYTTFELSAILENRLGDRFLQDPQVTVRISEVNGQQFTVDGAIGKPGMYPVRGSLTLLQALALSGGPAPNANLEGIVIFRTVEGKRLGARFDLRKIRSGESVDPVVYGNDLIVVDGVEANTALDDILKGIPLLGLFMAF
jgi:polysaccharide export outer membrane protein